MNKGKKLIKDTGVLFIGNFVTKILSFFMVPLYTSVLTTSEYGVADLISTTVLLLLPTFSLLMDEAVLRFALDKAKSKQQILSIAMYVSTFGFFIILCLSPILLLIESLKPYFLYIILYYISLWFYNILTCYVKGLDKMSMISIAGIIHAACFIGLNLVFLLVFKWGIYGYLLSTSLSNIIVAIILFIYSKAYCAFLSPKKLDKGLVREMIGYSLPLIPNYLSWWVINCSDRYMLLYMLGASATGIYSIAYKIPSLLSSVTSIFASAWTLSAVNDFGSEESKKFYKQVFSIYSCALLVGGAVLILLTKFLAGFLFANDFYVAWKSTLVLIFAFIISAQAIFLSSIFTASKKTQKAAIPALIGSIINIGINFALIPILGEIGAAIGTLVGYFAILLLNNIFTKKLLGTNLLGLKHWLCYGMVIIEIGAILSQSVWGWILAGACIIGVFGLNIRNIVDLMSSLFEKIKGRKMRQEETNDNERESAE